MNANEQAKEGITCDKTPSVYLSDLKKRKTEAERKILDFQLKSAKETGNKERILALKENREKRLSQLRQDKKNWKKRGIKK